MFQYPHQNLKKKPEQGKTADVSPEEPPVETESIPVEKGQLHSSDSSQKDLVQGWAPPPTPLPGPNFLSLKPEQQAALRRVHQNLGHPPPKQLAQFFRDRGVADEVVRGALDYVCDVCVETQRGTKTPKPSQLSPDRDFNDLVRIDGFWWKSNSQVTVHITYFLDEGSGFHLGGSV